MRNSDLAKLNNAHSFLYDIVVAVDKRMPINVLSTHRTPEEQFDLYKKGREMNEQGEWIITDKSKVVTYKDGYKKLSKHNYFPSKAVDITPDPLDWKDIPAFNRMCDITQAEADRLGIQIRQGRQWRDYPHQELIW